MVHPDKLLILIIVSLLLLTTIAPARAAGWKLTTGRVKKLVRGEENLELTLQPDRPTAVADEDSRPGTDSDPPAELVVKIPLQVCPGELKVGDQVRIWSKDAPACYRVLLKNRHDPTGVRARLRRHGRGFGGRRGGRRGHGGGGGH